MIGKAGKRNAEEKTTLLPVSSSDDPRSTLDAEIRALPETGEIGLTAAFVGYVNSQDAVLLCVACIVLYLCLAILAFSVVFESWSIVDSLYYAVVTFTTSKLQNGAVGAQMPQLQLRVVHVMRQLI